MIPRLGSLVLAPVGERPDLLAASVRDALDSLESTPAFVAEIDPTLADTAALTDAHGLDPDDSGNCVIIHGKRGGEIRPAACVVMSSTRADVNGLARRQLEARKASFAPQDWAVDHTGMEYGGITPIGLPQDWPILVDQELSERDWVILGSGLRRSKLVVPGRALGRIAGARILEGLGQIPT